MSRCAHFDEIQRIIAATEPGGTAKYPQPPADVIAACPDRCHDVWKIINGHKLPRPDTGAMSEPLGCPVCGLSLPSVPLTLGANLDVQVCSSLCAWRWEHNAYTIPGEEWTPERDNRHGEFANVGRTMSGEIYTLLPKVAAAIGAVHKDKSANMGAGGSFSFRGIDDLLNACHDALAEHGVSVLPSVAEHRLIERERVKQGAVVGMTIHVVVGVDYTFAAPDGSTVTVRTYGEAADTGDKATSKAMSQALKYALMHTFTVPTAEVAKDDKAKAPDMGGRALKEGDHAPAGYDRTRRNKRMMALFNELGMARAARLAYASEHVGRDLATASDLTDDEMEALIGHLEAEASEHIIREESP